MFHTFEYKPGYFIHVTAEKGNEKVRWQGPDYRVHSVNTVHGAKMQITKEIRMRTLGVEIC